MDEARSAIRAELARRELARRSYAAYLAYVQGPGWKRTRLSEFLAGRVQAFLERQSGAAYEILVIETPPQHGKSSTVTETLPSWALGRRPDWRVIIAGYDSDFAERFCRRNKEKLKACGKTLFGVSVGAVDRAQELELSNGRGRLISRGLMAGITGNPAELIVIDDPVKNRQEADSAVYRDRLWEEWQGSLKSRLAAGGKVIVIMTPWHEDDLAARILKSEPCAELLRLPVEAEENDPLGRAPGEALCPELGKDERWLRQFKAGYLADARGGQRAWQALYQCSPRREEGNLIPRRWWRRYDPDEPRRYAVQLISVDAAFKGGEDNDFVSVQVWGKLGRDYYLRYCLNRHLDFPQTLAAIRSTAKLYPEARTVLIEDKANGPAVIQTLRRELFCIPVDPLGGKIARVNAVAPAIESGHVFVPTEEKAPWTAAFIDQFAAFPSGAHDDMVDAASQALSRLIGVGGTPPAEPDGETLRRRDGERAFTDPERLFDPYGG
ncbi:MAG: phage terminase large subunit [Oscillospiraceae bacterium]|nr:phage terminase large subunit [Oscillospiraceae bacterium]